MCGSKGKYGQYSKYGEYSKYGQYSKYGKAVLYCQIGPFCKTTLSNHKKKSFSFAVTTKWFSGISKSVACHYGYTIENTQSICARHWNWSASMCAWSISGKLKKTNVSLWTPSERNSNYSIQQETIERNTFPHKYKRIRRQTDLDDDEDDGEKCTICLSMFEIENDVR